MSTSWPFERCKRRVSSRQKLPPCRTHADTTDDARLNTEFAVADGIIVVETVGSQGYVMRAVLFPCVHDRK